MAHTVVIVLVIFTILDCKAKMLKYCRRRACFHASWLPPWLSPTRPPSPLETASWSTSSTDSMEILSTGSNSQSRSSHHSICFALFWIGNSFEGGGGQNIVISTNVAVLLKILGRLFHYNVCIVIKNARHKVSVFLVVTFEMPTFLGKTGFARYFCFRQVATGGALTIRDALLSQSGWIWYMYFRPYGFSAWGWGSEGYGYQPIVAPPRPNSFYGGYFNYRYYPGF